MSRRECSHCQLCEECSEDCLVLRSHKGKMYLILVQEQLVREEFWAQMLFVPCWCGNQPHQLEGSPTPHPLIPLRGGGVEQPANRQILDIVPLIVS